jgi:ATP-binding cassette subfamily A (ABC1) protein 3
VGEHGDDNTKINIQSRIEARRKEHAVNHDHSGAPGIDLEEGQALLGNSSTDGSSLLASSANLGRLNRGFALKLQQLRALIVKRALHSFRNKWAIVTQLLLPMIFVFVALLVATTYPGPTDSPARQMYDIESIYGPNRVYITDRAAWNSNSTSESHGFATRMAQGFRDQQCETVVEVYAGEQKWDNFSDYLLDLINGKPRELAQFNKDSMFGFSFEPAALLLKPVVWFNGNGYHTISEGLLLMQQALLRNYTDTDNFVLTMTNSPLPRNDLERAQDQSDNMMGFFVSFTIVFGMAFLASSFVLFLVTEVSSACQ